MPKVSIIVPVYNGEKFLCRCLDSITAQTFTDFEAVLIDDGSTDQSGNICDEYAAKDGRIVVVHKQNEGVAKARITAFEHCKGELITFIDADDYVAPDYLQKLSKPIIEDDADIVSCEYYILNGSKTIVVNGRITGSFCNDKKKEFLANHFFYDKSVDGYGMSVYLWTKMVRRSLVLDALKTGEEMWYGEDQIAVFQMLLNSKKLVIIPDRLYYYVQHEGQTMNKYNMSLWDNLVMLMEKYEKLDKDGLFKEGIRKRTWRHINLTLFTKMPMAQLTRKEFCNHLSQMREMPYVKKFFSPLLIDFNLKENIKYWFLKLKLYNLFYYRIARK